MAIPTKKPPMPKTTTGKSSTMGNKGGAVRGQARAAQVQARNAARKAAKVTKGKSAGKGKSGI